MNRHIFEVGLAHPGAYQAHCESSIVSFLMRLSILYDGLSVCRSVTPSQNRMLRFTECTRWTKTDFHPCLNFLRFKTRKMAYIHQRLIHAPRSIPCEICGKLFKARLNLKCHMETHTTEKNHRCEICGNTYKQKKALDKHKRYKGH